MSAAIEFVILLNHAVLKLNLDALATVAHCSSTVTSLLVLAVMASAMVPRLVARVPQIAVSALNAVTVVATAMRPALPALKIVVRVPLVCCQIASCQASTDLLSPLPRLPLLPHQSPRQHL
jgi:CBS domain containing-hemolysin-like protein